MKGSGTCAPSAWARHRTFILRTLFVCVCSVATLVAWKAVEWRIDEWRMANYPLLVMRQEAELSYSECKSRLVREVKHYIDSVAPASSLTAYAVVDCCERYDLDVAFVLAQGQVESRFGTVGMAAKTNSVFNVGAYDGLSVEEVAGRYRYRHPDHSIEPYMKLLYSRYISGTRTEHDLMARYVDVKGRRYASDPQYEQKLLDAYSRIGKNTPIPGLQGEMRRFRIISGM